MLRFIIIFITFLPVWLSRLLIKNAKNEAPTLIQKYLDWSKKLYDKNASKVDKKTKSK